MDVIFKSLVEEFQSIDRNNREQFKEWLTKYHYLTLADYAKIAGVNLDVIRKWRRSVGVPPSVNRRVQNIPSAPPTVLPPEVWDNPEWLREAAKKHGKYYIAKMVGRSTTTIKERLRALGVKPRDYREAIKSKNPYFNKDWVYYNYVEKQQSAKKCSELAGVSVATFMNWLNKFDIPIRTLYDATTVGKNSRKQSKKQSNSRDSKAQ